MKDSIIKYLKFLRDEIVLGFETLENGAQFKKKTWDHLAGSGGGEMSIIRGKVFEKAAVNWSGVGGSHFPMKDAQGAFFATGVSLITHMSNPHAPTVHMNVRYIETKNKCWFGGGYDLTPMGFPYQEDTKDFHAIAKKTLDPFGKHLYPQFSQKAAEYFYIPHRKKERGVGGIFFDHYHTGDLTRDRKMWESVGNSLLASVIPIYHRRINSKFTKEDRQKQLTLRGHYAEFNLVYDRGTKFGFQSGGNPEAILCSMPPTAAW